MRCIILANGEYGELDAYMKVLQSGDRILCADGGANYARRLNMVPECIIGDMDSILPEVRDWFQAQGVAWKKYSRRKDYTDTQLALSMAEDMGASEIIFLGSLGNRLDHTLSNLYSSMGTVLKGIRVVHYSPHCQISVVNKPIAIEGRKGDIVSLLALTETVCGVTLEGFEYPLHDVVLEKMNPYAISNVMEGSRGLVSFTRGVLAVFHYYQRS